MRSEKLTHEQKKEFLEFLNIDREPAAGEDRKPRANFFTEGFQEREEIQKRIEEPLFNSTNERDELFREFRLKKKLFFLFIEYFFLNGRVPFFTPRRSQILNKVKGQPPSSITGRYQFNFSNVLIQINGLFE